MKEKHIKSNKYILHILNTDNNIVLYEDYLPDNLQEKMLKIVFGNQFRDLEEQKLLFELSNPDTITCQKCNGIGRTKNG